MNIRNPVMQSLAACTAVFCLLIAVPGRSLVSGALLPIFASSLLRQVILGALILLPWSLSFAAAGDLDPSFDGDGIVLTDFGVVDWAADAAIQMDGKIVAAGASGSDFALARYNPDGSLDTSFDFDGRVTTEFGGGGDYAQTVVIQSDGKIIAAGRFSPGGGRDDFALVRYNPDGSLDSSFGVSGKVITNLGRSAVVLDVAIQSDRKIVAVGSPFFQDFTLARYNPDGSLDTTFGVNGVVVTDFNGDDEGHVIVIQSDGKMVAAGISGGDFALARYDLDGSLDMSFGIDGKVTTDFGGYDGVRGIALQSDGKVVLDGFSEVEGNIDSVLARYNTDGSLDTSFDFDGKVRTDVGGGNNDDFLTIAIQSDGKIVAAGRLFLGRVADDFTLVRYNSDGSLDTSFGTNGVVLTDIGGSDAALAIVIQPSDGKYVLAGASDAEETFDIALARYFAEPVGESNVDIDIKPGDRRNIINPRARGGIWVAVLSNSEFDALQVDIRTARFGPDRAKAIRHRVRDVNRDGLADLLLQFRIHKTGIECGDTNASLSGVTYSGESFSGTDSVAPKKCRPAPRHREVSIDIKPNSSANKVYPGVDTNLYVAVLSDTATMFDPRNIDVPTVRFGPGNATVRSSHTKDFNGDGIADLVLRFSNLAAGIQCGDTEATLTATTMSGETITGSDFVSTRGC